MRKLLFVFFALAVAMAASADYAVPAAKDWVWIEGGAEPVVSNGFAVTGFPFVEARLPDTASLSVGDFSSFKTGVVVIVR